MKITENMNLNELKDRMGEASTMSDARNMAKLLYNAPEGYSDTAEVPEGEWVDMLSVAASDGDYNY